MLTGFLDRYNFCVLYVVRTVAYGFRTVLRFDRSFHWCLNYKPSLTFTNSGPWRFPWLIYHGILCYRLFFPCSDVFYLHAVSQLWLLVKPPPLSCSVTIYFSKSHFLRFLFLPYSSLCTLLPWSYHSTHRYTNYWSNRCMGICSVTHACALSMLRPTNLEHSGYSLTAVGELLPAQATWANVSFHCLFQWSLQWFHTLISSLTWDSVFSPIH